MTSWQEFGARQPDLAADVRAAFGARKHATIATLRLDGAPRISGIEVELTEDGVFVGMMPGSVKARDALRDPRVALHSPTLDPPDGDPASWPGEAKISGTVVDESTSDEAHWFRIEPTEIVHTKVAPEADRLTIRTWHPGRGLQVVDRR